MNIDEFFKKKVENIIKNSKEGEIYIFKGFSINQIKWIIQHPNSLLNDSNLFNGNELNLEVINSSWITIISNISTSKKTLIGFYEELLVIKDELLKLPVNKFIIIENNILSPWVPSFLSSEINEKIFDFLKSENETEDSTIKLLSKYYCDIKLLHNEKALALPIILEGNNIIYEKFWEEYEDINGLLECDNDNDIVKKIEVGSIEYWNYCLSCSEGMFYPVVFLKNQSKNFQNCFKGLVGLLLTFDIKFKIIEIKNTNKKIINDTAPFVKILKKYWGESAEFRKLKFYKDPDISKDIINISQGELIAEVVEQCELSLNNYEYQNIFITAPTGSGKSILFQIPTIYLTEKYNCVVIVVSPLIALMNDQVIQLEKQGIKIACCINSTMTIDERRKIIEEIQNGKKSLLYLAPEFLLTVDLKTFLGGRKIGLVVIDEAHIVTSWGKDFRADYWFLGDFLKKAKRNGFDFPALCLTATAVYSGDDDVVNDTIDELGLEKTIIHLGNVKRENISFDIVCHNNDRLNTKIESEKYKLTIERLREYINSNKEKVLAYFPYRRQVDEIYTLMDDYERMRISRYHSKVPAIVRKMTELAYKQGNVLGLVCTKAFGMGVDVGDIKHVIHFAPTGTLADYVQEIGRAARNKNMEGIAHMDYFKGDIRYVRILNSLSEMRQYQLQSILKKISSIYELKKKRNILLSVETFEYLFKENDVENKTKTGLMLLAKDLLYKYTFPVLIVKPKLMLSKNYVNVPFEIEDVILKKYGNYMEKQNNITKHHIITYYDKFGEARDTFVSNSGNIYVIDMAKIWENFYPDLTFGMFKKKFFEEVVEINGENYKLNPRVRVEIKYEDKFENVCNKVQNIVDSIVNIFAKHKKSENNKLFTLKEFEKELNTMFEEKIISHDKVSLLLDIFTESVNESANYNNDKKQLRVIRKRQQTNFDETVYFVSSSAYSRLTAYFMKKLKQCNPEKNNIFYRYYPLSKDKSIDCMPLLRLLELIGLATYEIRGGEKAEVFIRINDPNKIKNLSMNNYRNSILDYIHKKHIRNQYLLAAFFDKDFTTEERWNIIEEYFLGNNNYVYEKLNMKNI